MGQQQSREPAPAPSSTYHEPPSLDLYAQPPLFPEEPKPYSSSPPAPQAEQQAPPAAYSYAPPRPSAVRGQQQPLWRWLLQDVGRRTVGVARVDLVRPRVPAIEEGGSIWKAGESEGEVGYPSVRHGYGGSAYSRMRRPEYGPDGSYRGMSEPNGFAAWGAARGARLKIMRSIEFGKPAATWQPPERRGQGSKGAASRLLSVLQQQPPTGGPWGGPSGLQPALFSFGCGANFELDNMHFSLQARLKYRDWFTLKLSPVPAIKLQKSFQLGRTPVMLRLQYEVPLDAVDEPLRPPARLLVRLDNHVGSGVRLGTTGLEVDQRLITLGPNAAVRFAGIGKFPRQVPVKEGEKLLEWQVERLGLKTRW